MKNGRVLGVASRRERGTRWDRVPRGREGGGREGRKIVEFPNSALKVHHLGGENDGPEADNKDRKSYLSLSSLARP